jgi:hypothetical protein
MYGRGIEVRFSAGARDFSSSQLPDRHRDPWVPEALSSGVKRPGRESDHSLPSTVEVKNARRYTSIPSHVFMACCLI